MKYPLVDHVKKNKHEMTTGNIAAIEFGTTSVALAYTITWDEEISTLGLNERYWDIRVPNVILLRKDGASLTMTSIGEEAKNNYTRMRLDDRKNYVYFETIKMLMKREKVHILISLVSLI